ncbi:MAG: hypothetical protein MUF54_01490 [Polyangiaceae bacterium]|jgi:hypothetical protein|nr:hypothetical protein [Polyangiaceae bacterium]
MNEKFCIYCKHYGENHRLKTSTCVCVRHGLTTCMVTGALTAKVSLNPFTERQGPAAPACDGRGRCGEEGQFFEAKE